MITVGDCVEVLAGLPECSVDAIVTDPPYGLEFMGKDWDRLDGEGWRSGGGFSKPGIGDRDTPWASYGSGDTANASCATCGGRMRGAKKCECDEPDWRVKGKPLATAGADSRQAQGRKMQEWHERWAREALRVLKPGGHLLAFGGTRTYHRLTCAIEDAGFEVRDCIAWMYGSGFPKSLDVSKAIDKAAGAEREVVERRRTRSGGMESLNTSNAGHGYRSATYSDGENVLDVTAPATPEAERWEGWGTALKPAYEPIVVARKPLAGTVAGNVLEHGTGALNIGGCRIGYEEGGSVASNPSLRERIAGGNGGHVIATESERRFSEPHGAGRWPANVVLSHTDECRRVGVREVRADGHFPAARGASGYGSAVEGSNGGGLRGQDGLVERSFDGELVDEWECVEGCPVAALDGQTGELGASRFFYCAKAGRAERSAGLDAFEKRPILWSSGEQNPGSFQAEGTERAARNPHPTVKPIEVMRWLVRLVTPPGGRVLDPFAGSGTTGIAAALEGFEFVGIEREPEYARIADARIRWWAEHPEGLPLEAALEADGRRRKVADSGQLGLL